jgi:hypothetical protein
MVGAMTSRAWLLTVVLIAAGCGKKGGAPSAGSGSAAPPAAPAPVAKVSVDAAVAAAPPAPPPPPVCFPADFHGNLDALTADDRQATICATNDTKASQCMSISLLTGKALVAQRPPAPPPPATGGYTIQDDATAVALCKGPGVCTKLALRPLPEGAAAGPSRIAVAPGGTVAVAPLADADKAKGLGLFDTSSGRRLKVLDVSGGDANYGCAEPGRFLTADVIYATANVCAGPGARGSLWKLDGTAIGALAAESNVEGGVPVQIDGDTWAVPTFGGGGALVFDLKSARALRSIAKVGDTIHLCDGCTPLGDASLWLSPLVKTPAGKLVEVSATGAVSVIDPATGKIDNAWPIPVCTRAPEPAGSAGPGAGSAL